MSVVIVPLLYPLYKFPSSRISTSVISKVNWSWLCAFDFIKIIKKKILRIYKDYFSFILFIITLFIKTKITNGKKTEGPNGIFSELPNTKKKLLT